MAETLNSYVFWFFIGSIPVILSVLTRPGKILYQDELRKKSSRYREIDKEYGRAHLLFLFYLLILASVWIVGLNEWSKLKFKVPFYPLVTIAFSSYAIFLAIFAMRSGVYPAIKSQDYGYADKDVINRKAKQSIYISLATMLFAVIIFLIVFNG